MREVFLRGVRTRGVWGCWFPLELALAFSAVYEIIESGVAAAASPTVGLAFLGAQDEVWDAQKDMLLAAAGAAIAMLIVALIHWRYDPAFATELRAGLRIRRGDARLDENALRER